MLILPWITRYIANENVAQTRANNVQNRERMFRERMSSKTVRDNAERYYG